MVYIEKIDKQEFSNTTYFIKIQPGSFFCLMFPKLLSVTDRKCEVGGDAFAAGWAGASFNFYIIFWLNLKQCDVFYKDIIAFACFL